MTAANRIGFRFEMGLLECIFEPREAALCVPGAPTSWTLSSKFWVPVACLAAFWGVSAKMTGWQ